MASWTTDPRVAAAVTRAQDERCEKHWTDSGKADNFIFCADCQRAIANRVKADLNNITNPKPRWK